MFTVGMTVEIEPDFRSEIFLRMRSLDTTLMTSLEFNPIRCATILCHFAKHGTVP